MISITYIQMSFLTMHKISWVELIKIRKKKGLYLKLWNNKSEQ